MLLLSSATAVRACSDDDPVEAESEGEGDGGTEALCLLCDLAQPSTDAVFDHMKVMGTAPLTCVQAEQRASVRTSMHWTSGRLH